MKWNTVRLFIQNFWQQATALKAFYLLYTVFVLLAGYAGYSGVQNFRAQQEIRHAHQTKARESWEANPDKHPHRMSHFGTFAFRASPPLSVFDYGLESFVGNAVFLEAHRQNSVNFSEATFSTGALRFGELSLALLLQLVLPLVLFFIGFSAVAGDKQNGTLKILLSQGAQWREIILGKALGLFGVGLLFLLPVLLFVGIAVFTLPHREIEDFALGRFIWISIGYTVFLFIISTVTVVVSALNKNPKSALLRLLGLWLLFVVLLPKSVQALGMYVHPTPTKLAFESAIEEDVIQKGDSHDPDDPYFNELRDSILAVHKVKEVTDLPFNYSGFIMKKGEEITSELYKKHYKKLINVYENQNAMTLYSSFFNPFSAIKQLSMVMAGTDFTSYMNFQDQADTYRYQLAQTMNELQMEYISPKKESGSEGKTHVIGHEHWEEFKDFRHQPMGFGSSAKEALPALASLLLWMGIAVGLLLFTSKRAKAI